MIRKSSGKPLLEESRGMVGAGQ